MKTWVKFIEYSHDAFCQRKEQNGGPVMVRADRVIAVKTYQTRSHTKAKTDPTNIDSVMLCMEDGMFISVIGNVVDVVAIIEGAEKLE